MRWPVIVVVLFVIFSYGSAYSQTTNASITGRVTDSSKALIVGAKIAAINVGTNVRYEAGTNQAGEYYVAGLPPGTYRIEVEKVGFKIVIKPDVVLHVEDAIEINFEMSVGSVSESVTVNASATNESPAVSLTVTRDFVENMPLNGRSLDDLIALAPGTVSTGGGYYVVNGQRYDANYFAVDGVAANLNPNAVGSENGDFSGLAGSLPAQTALGTTQSLISVDALQEFKVQTSTYSAEYGRQPGGQVELTSRSGTDEIHGSLFDYLRNTVFDSNDYFRNLGQTPRAPERQNDYGGTLGGPLEIPHVYDGKDRTFYFVSYEGLHLLQPSPASTSDVASTELRVFAAPGVQSFLNSQVLPNGPENGDQCALSLGFTFSCTARYTSNTSNQGLIGSMNFRVDHSFGSRIQAFVRYADVSSSTSTVGSNQASSLTGNSHGWTLGLVARVTPNMVADVRYNYSYASTDDSQTPVAYGGAVPYPTSLVAPASDLTGAIRAGVGIVLAGAGNINGATPFYEQNLFQQTQNNIVGSLAWTHGKHTFKFGADFRHLAPVFNPYTYESRMVILNIASVQQGISNILLTRSALRATPTFNGLSLYSADSWKVSSRFSVDYGLRWEFNPAPGPSNGLYPLALTTGNLSTATLAPSGTPQYHSVYHDFAPRLGLAYALSSGSRPLVVRAGAGLFFDTGATHAIAGYGSYPFGLNLVTDDVPLPASQTALEAPALGGPLTPPYGLLAANDPNLVAPYTLQWSLSLDKVLNDKNTFTLSYVGNTGKKLLYTAEDSPSNPLFTTVEFTNNSGASKYNALNLQDRGFLAPGLQVVGNYTLAHSSDNFSQDTNNVNEAPQWGNSDFDVRQVFSLALNYQVPSLTKDAVWRKITNDWLVSFLSQAQSGYPIDVFQGEYALPNGELVYVRPDLIPGVPVYLHNQDVPGVIGGWALNYAAFLQIPTDPNTGAPLQASNLGRNYFHGPGFYNINLAIQKTVPIHERLSVVFRAEAFNLLNHTNGGSIDNYLPDGPGVFGIADNIQTIGTPNGLYASGAPRSLQFLLKLMF